MELDYLTPEEKNIWQALYTGKSYRQIADYFDIPINFIQTVIKYLFRKISVRDRYEAIEKYQQLKQTQNL